MRTLALELLAVVAACILFTPPQTAKAAGIVSPYAGNDITVMIGQIDFYESDIAAICIETASGQQFWYWLGLDGMAGNNTLFLNSGRENVIMPSSTPVTGCGVSFRPLKLMGHVLTIQCGAGNDTFVGGGAGDGTVVLTMDNGNDVVHSYVPNIRIWGGYGKDTIFSHHSASSVQINSGPDDDCVQAGTYNAVYCSSGFGDKSVTPGFDCEIRTNSCP